MSATLRWRGVEDVIRNMHTYEQRVLFAVNQVALYFQGVFEEYAKLNAPWTDRTSNARQSLHAFVEKLSQDVVRIYLSGGVAYQIFLETGAQGRYAIIWPTIQAHLPEVKRKLDQIFK